MHMASGEQVCTSRSWNLLNCTSEVYLVIYFSGFEPLESTDPDHFPYPGSLLSENNAVYDLIFILISENMHFMNSREYMDARVQ